MPNAASLMGATNDALMNGLLMMLVGMAVVFGALILIMLMLLAMHRFFTNETKPAMVAQKAPSAVEPATKPVAQATGDEMGGVAPEIIAIISAAVVAIAGSRARIRSIRLVRPVGQSPWADQGRSRHHQSHRVHRGKR